MKLLLTSGGITNKSIADALFDLVGKKPEDTSLVFIPTASNVEKGDKGWLLIFGHLPPPETIRNYVAFRGEGVL